MTRTESAFFTIFYIFFIFIYQQLKKEMNNVKNNESKFPFYSKE